MKIQIEAYPKKINSIKMKYKLNLPRRSKLIMIWNTKIIILNKNITRIRDTIEVK